MKKKLIVLTTYQDKSLPLFFSEKVKNDYEIEIFLFHESLPIFEQKFKNSEYTDLYIRDPFNGKTVDYLEEKLNVCFAKNKHTNLIDNLETVADVYFEDKWLQYQTLKEFMPQTQILESLNYDLDTSFIKKRISSRAKGIVFNLESVGEKNEYIVQPKLPIKHEYRIFSVNSEILLRATYKKLIVKQKENNEASVRIMDLVEVDDELKSFVEKIDAKLKFDFIGYDIARLADDSLVLIEANRSPQFLMYYEKTGINLAEKLLA